MLETETVNPETVNTDKKEFFEVRVYVKGVRRKCRKPEFKGLKLPDAPLNIKDDAEKLEAFKKDARTLIHLAMKPETVQPNVFIDFQYAYTRDSIPDLVTSHPFDESNFKIPLEL
jgi:hypothetical protein